MRAVAIAGAALVVSAFFARADAEPSGEFTVGAVVTQPLGVSQARKFLSCKTRMTFMPVHGTQVSYSRPDGAIFLWYPGNSVVLPGRWEIRASHNLPPTIYSDMCFFYFTSGLNPATGQPGNKWSCLRADVLVRLTIEGADGDVFGLARRKAVPFVLTRDKTTIADLAKLIPQVDLTPGRPDSGCEDAQTRLRYP